MVIYRLIQYCEIQRFPRAWPFFLSELSRFSYRSSSSSRHRYLRHQPQFYCRSKTARSAIKGPRLHLSFPLCILHKLCALFSLSHFSSSSSSSSLIQRLNVYETGVMRPQDEESINERSQLLSPRVNELRRRGNDFNSEDVESIISSHLSKEEQALGNTAIGERLPYNDYTTIDWLHDLVSCSPHFEHSV